MVLPLGASLGGVGGVRVRERGGAILAIPGPRIPSVSVDGAVRLEFTLMGLLFVRLELELTLMGLLFVRLELELTLMGRLGADNVGAATADISSDGIAFADDVGAATADITPYGPEASDDDLDALLDALGALLLRRMGSSSSLVRDRASDVLLDGADVATWGVGGGGGFSTGRNLT